MKILIFLSALLISLSSFSQNFEILIKNGKIISEKKFEEYAEEYLNSYADASVKGELSDSMLVKVGEFLSKLFRGKGYTKIKFESGKDVKEFLRNYVKDVKMKRFPSSKNVYK